MHNFHNQQTIYFLMQRFLFSLLLLIYFVPISLTGQARDGNLPVSLSIFNNGTSLPGQGYAGLMSKTFHPGFSIGLTHNYKTKKTMSLFQTFKLGYFYHRHAQSGIQLYTEAGYRYQSSIGIYGEALLGVGYLHSIPDMQQFKWTEEGYVSKTNLGRPQAMGTVSLVAGYHFKNTKTFPHRLFVQYQFWIQAPFVNKYVPVLPNTALHVGLVYYLPKKNTQKNS